MMFQAIELGKTSFVKEVLCRGLPLSPEYVYEAVRACATLKGYTRNIWILFESGWDT